MDSDSEIDAEVAGTDIDVEALNQALDARRQALGLTWTRVESLLGIEHPTLSRYRKGEKPSLISYFKMVRWLHLPPDTFMSRDRRRPAVAQHPKSEVNTEEVRDRTAGNEDVTAHLTLLLESQTRIEASQALVASKLDELTDRLAPTSDPDMDIASFDPERAQHAQLAELIHTCLVKMLGGKSLQGSIQDLSEEGHGYVRKLAAYAVSRVTPLAEAVDSQVPQMGSRILVTREEWAVSALKVFPALSDNVPLSAIRILSHDPPGDTVKSVGRALLSYLGSAALLE
ncbi:MAG TPA: helix-turn-helix transcriptional regulator [Acidimicrobiales bacterium]|nr:helix-turn-helix transcriptional regulator [Acidimicrobiales bacterium]